VTRAPSDTALEGSLVTDAVSGRAYLRTWRIVVVDGPHAGREVSLGHATAFVGSAKGLDLVLDDPRVSRRHAELVPAEDGVRVRDLESRNGTYVGQKRVADAFLGAGALVRVGRTKLRLEAVDAPFDPGGEERFGPLRAKSAAMQQVFSLLRRASPLDATILLEGETGVGKEVLAETIHQQSARKTGPFVIFDCGSVAPELIASELFGHRRGAFTGAVSDRVGIFEAARGGTVFLDEIGELDLKLQPTLLRALESRQVRRVGEVEQRPIDVRVLCATNRSLKEEVDAKRFRADLFHRLAVVRCRIPSLRERREDIPLLVDELLKRLGRKPSAVDPATMRTLMRHAWPGNVRELRNVLEQAAALSGDKLDVALDVDAGAPAPATLSGAGGSSSVHRSRGGTQHGSQHGSHHGASRGLAIDDLMGQPYREARDEALARFEAAYLKAGLAKHDGNVSAFARDSGIARNYLHRLLRRNGIRRVHVDT
jgi:DNA-binding NtrC family response regulator